MWQQWDNVVAARCGDAGSTPARSTSIVLGQLSGTPEGSVLLFICSTDLLSRWSSELLQAIAEIYDLLCVDSLDAQLGKDRSRSNRLWLEQWLLM